jgi:hypothetical protein
MIPISTAQEDLVLGDNFGVYLKVEVEKSSSTSAYTDFTSYGGSNWIEGARLRDSVDQRVGSASVSLTREVSSSNSISPLRGDSTLNQTSSAGEAFAVAVDREMKVSVATIAASCSPVSTDYQLLFRGDIDDWDASKSPMQLSARDPGGFLLDRWIETSTAYGSSSGTAIETVMQEILDDTLGSTDIAVNASSTPGFLITKYEQQRQPILTALQTLADLIGWVVRYRWSTGDSDFTLQFYPPARTSTTPSSTFGPDRYVSLPRLSVDRADIRNVVDVIYPDSVSSGIETVTVQSSSSIDKYGRQWMSIREPDDSSITTSSEANTLGQAVIDDLSEPDVEQGADMHIWPYTELGDLYRWSANSVHYNADQDLAVVSYEHELSQKRHRTRMDLRGKPRSGTKDWLGKGDKPKSTEPGKGRLEVDQTVNSTNVSITARSYLNDVLGGFLEFSDPARTFTGTGSISSGDATLTVSDGDFATEDEKLYISVAAADSGGATLVSRVNSVTSTTVVELEDNAEVTVSTQNVALGGGFFSDFDYDGAAENTETNTRNRPAYGSDPSWTMIRSVTAGTAGDPVVINLTAQAAPSLNSFRCLAVDDSTDVVFGYSWSVSAGVDDTYSLYLDGGYGGNSTAAVTGTEGSPASNSTKNLTDSGGGTGSSREFWANCTLKDSASNVIQTLSDDGDVAL